MPVLEAQYVVVIASKTGLAPEFIRWELPLWQGWAYYHAARLLEGELFRWPGASGADAGWIKEALGWAKSLKKPKANH